MLNASSALQLLTENLPASVVNNLRRKYVGKNIAVTGGGSFIGSHLVDALLDFGAHVTVLDDFSSGNRSNFMMSESLSVVEVDLRSREATSASLPPVDILFHLAAIHGGRGFIEKYKGPMLGNLAIDNNVFEVAVSLNVGMIVHASSACAYPLNLQTDEDSRYLLEEKYASMTRQEFSSADGVYGWTKLIGEFQLENLTFGTKSKGRSARIFTAYGERENLSHAAIALIAKSLLKIEPFPVWGNGKQTRNFTYVSDTVTGLLLLGADDREIGFDVFNVGTDSHISINEFIQSIFQIVDWYPRSIDYQLDRPTGVKSRASNNSKIKEVFGWEPKISISAGLRNTIAWYIDSGLLPESAISLEVRLESR